MDDVRELNKEILRRLHTKQEGKPDRKPAPRLLEIVATCNEKEGVFALGKLFEKLRAFATVVDFSHPDIGSVFDGALDDDTDFGAECAEVLALAHYSRDKGLSRVGPFLWRILSTDLPKEVVRRIDSPFVNRLHVRFLKDAQDRETVRRTKRVQCIDLRTLCKKGEEVWAAQPSSLAKFIRYDMAYQEELVKVEKKSKRYLDLGLTDMHAEVMKTVDAFRQQVEESYYGFNRITMTSAAVILAKSLEYNLHQPLLIAEFSSTREYRIVVESRHFRGFNFAVEGREVVATTATPARREPPPVAYEPRVYPLYELWDFAPQTVKEIIGLTDNFPDADGRPIFDHYGVIVPGVNYPKEKDKLFVAEDGGVRSFDTLEEAKKALDLTLINKKLFFPIVVGEKDGKCYFISYFA